MSTADDSTYTFFLNINFKGPTDDVSIMVRKIETKKFKIDMFKNYDSKNPFFVCETIDGKYVGINLSEIESAYIVCESLSYMENLCPHEGPINIWLKKLKQPIEIIPEDYKVVHDLFINMQHGNRLISSIIDEDGDELCINLEQLVYIELPIQMYTKGCEIAEAQSQFDECYDENSPENKYNEFMIEDRECIPNLRVVKDNSTK